MITIYGADWCSACKKAKQLCEDKNITFEFFDISEEPEALQKLRERLGKEPSTIPLIYENDTLIGGFTAFNDMVHKKF